MSSDLRQSGSRHQRAVDALPDHLDVTDEAHIQCVDCDATGLRPIAHRDECEHRRSRPAIADGGMERVTTRIPGGMLDQIDLRVERGEYPNRSEAIRAAVRRLCMGDSDS